MIKALICDLDNTLFATDGISAEVVQPVIDALLAANIGVDAVGVEALYRAIDDCWHRPFDLVAQEYGLSDRLRAAWHSASASLRVTEPLTPYADVPTLALLPLTRFLVTSGYRRFQESKISALGISHLFERVYIDALDDLNRQGKERIFRGILGRHGWAPAEVLVLGDSAESELAAGRRLGMPTIQVLRRGVTRAAEVRFWIRGLEELAPMIDRLNQEP
ncbi:MAG: HAD family hydrolase [Gemmatimonadales bacterium]